VLEADVIVHVRDIAAEDTLAEKRDVEQVLKKLFGSEAFMARLIEAHNKIDLLSGAETPELSDLPVVRISALTGEGCIALLSLIEEKLAAHLSAPYHFTLATTAGKELAWLYRHAQITKRRDSEKNVKLTAHLSPADAAKFEKLFGIKAN
jgi:GTP-binding protein HflX